MSSRDREQRVGLRVVILAGAMLALLLGLVAAAPDPVGAQGGESVAPDRLDQMKKALGAAHGARKQEDSNESLKEARELKHRFRDDLFRGPNAQRIFTCNADQSRFMFKQLEAIDVNLDVAGRLHGEERKKGIKKAFDELFLTASTLGNCRDSGGPAVLDAFKTLIVRVGKVKEKADDLTDNQLDTRTDEIEALKGTMLSESRIHNCEAFRFYSLIKRVDVHIELALEEKEKERRKDRVEDAMRAAERLIEFWTVVPCGSSIAPPGGEEPPPGGGTPGAPQCSNGVDDADAEDTIADHPADFGCLSPQDIDEKDLTFGFVCPGEGEQTTNVFDFGFGGGTATGYRLRIVASGAIFDESSSANHGARPHNGTSPCGTAAAHAVSAGVGPNAPSCPGCQPVGAETLRVVVHTLAEPGVTSGTHQIQMGVASQ